MQASKETLASAILPDTTIRSYQGLVDGLIDPETRSKNLLLLKNNKDSIPNLAQMLWYTPGVMAVILHEIVSVYPLLFTPELEEHRAPVCAAMQLMQVVAVSGEVCINLLDSGIYLYLFPFLKVAGSTSAYESMRLSGLSVIYELSKHSRAVIPLMKTEIVSICTNVMRNSHELNKRIALSIIQKLLRDLNGRVQICGDDGMLNEVISAIKDLMDYTLKRNSFNEGGGPGGLYQDKEGQTFEKILDCFASIADDQDGLIGLGKDLHPLFLDSKNAESFADEKLRKKYLGILERLSGDIRIQQQQQQQQQQPVYMTMSAY